MNFAILNIGEWPNILRSVQNIFWATLVDQFDIGTRFRGWNFETERGKLINRVSEGTKSISQVFLTGE
jgi:hypothetical protein